jgi:outer membrane lipoprotein-sorting protein
MKLRFVLLLLLVLAASTTPCPAQELPTDTLDALRGLRDGLRLVHGEFTQEKELAMFEQPLISRGRFLIRPPEDIDWIYTEPAEFGFSIRDGEVTRWNAVSGTSRTTPLARDPILAVIQEQMLAWSTMDTATLERFFSFRQYADDPIGLEFTPKKSALGAIISRVRIRLAADMKHIREIVIVDPDNDTTRIRLENVHVNQEPPAGLF